MAGGPHDKAAQGYHSGRPTVGAGGMPDPHSMAGVHAREQQERAQRMRQAQANAQPGTPGPGAQPAVPSDATIGAYFLRRAQGAKATVAETVRLAQRRVKLDQAVRDGLGPHHPANGAFGALNTEMRASRGYDRYIRQRFAKELGSETIVFFRSPDSPNSIDELTSTLQNEPDRLKDLDWAMDRLKAIPPDRHLENLKAVSLADYEAHGLRQRRDKLRGQVKLLAWLCVFLAAVTAVTLLLYFHNLKDVT
ncbi:MULTISPECIES: hypothetical protein [Mameliella]|uniref:hypothetical protein n=1 Tax=Mameliella TaxID=1434019 RepID=UPI000B537124|nr:MULTISPECIES: hypothetical protein [Mameliella]MCR9275331.1 hypothetical protein [Paracoccaceae bacterium]OWV61100.1 hypothetical protein CDZ98_08710 [Mameliella alba]